MIIHKIPKFIRSLVPYGLKRFLVRIYIRWLLRGSPGKFDKPRLSFAGILPPEGSFIRGGKVKLTYLRKRFGEYNQRFNILYLVSSTLPGFADIWVEEAKRRGIKIVWNQNGVGYPAWTPLWEKVNASMKPIEQADFVIYQSEFCREEADEIVARFTGPQTVINNCIDTSIIIPADPPLPLIPVRLLITGTHMTPEKVMVPLEATRKLLDRGFDVTLDIYGPGEWPDAEKDIENKIAELKLEKIARQHGKYLQKDSAKIYQSGHILIYIKYMDPSPTSVLSGISAGLPVIGSKSGGVTELIPPSVGILLEVPDSREKLFYPSAEAVAQAVEKIIPEWATWSREAREHAVRNFDDKNWLDAHEKVFEQVLKNHG